MMDPEQQARGEIDPLLEQAGRVIQNRSATNLQAARWVTIRSPSRGGLDEFVDLYKSKNRAERKSAYNPKHKKGRWRAFDLNETLACDKAGADIYWLKDESFEGTAHLPDPEVIAQEIVEDLEDAAEQLRGIAIPTEKTKAGQGQRNVSGL